MLFATPSLINLQWYTKFIIYNYRAKCIYQRRNKPTITTTAGRRDGIQSCYSSSSHSSILFTHNDSKQSTEDTIIHHDSSSHPSNKFDDYDYLPEYPPSLQPPQLVDAHHWFTELLPEGWCVGVIGGHGPSSSGTMMMMDDAETTTTTTTTTTTPRVTTSPTINHLLLHPDEHRWGIDHITSDTSRKSYYLGRMALRSSMSVLLDNNYYSQIMKYSSIRNGSSLELEDDDDDDSNNNNNYYYYYYTRLKDQICNMAINKDTHGRPILPNIISGSISHKEGCAVGLSTFRCSSTTTANPIISTMPSINLNLDIKSDDVAATTTTSMAWQEECPLLDDDNDDKDGSLLSSNNNNNNNNSNNNNNNNNNSSPSSTNNAVVHGVGIDLERIDGNRGKRIQNKVLTENEVRQLGGLIAIGISCDEEVILRFRYIIRGGGATLMILYIITLCVCVCVFFSSLSNNIYIVKCPKQKNTHFHYSLKESVYKAMHPILCQYVGFHEAEITPRVDGTAKVSLQLVPHGRNNDIDIVIHSASWKKIGNDFFITSASVGTV